jgi:CheY-like chemotaxis protein
MAARILIVEDDSASLELTKYLLEKAGYTVGSAMTGADGVRAALRNEFDLVLCDLQLPEFSGFEVIRRLRSNPAWRAVPVIAVSAYSMPDDRSAALAAGFAEFLTKPIDPESFLHDIALHLSPGRRAGDD